MLSLWAIGLLGFLNQVEAQWTSPYQSQAQQTAAQFSQRGWGTSPAARMPWARMPNNIPNMNGGMPGGVPGGMTGGVPGGMAGGVPGGMPGGVPGGMTGGVPGGMAGGVPGGMPGGIPGGMPRSMNPNMMSNAMVQNRYPQQQYMGPTPTNSICVAPVSQPRLCMVNGENTHKYRLKDVIEFLGHPNVEKVPKCVPGVPRVNCADYYAAQYIWKRGYCYCKNFHKNLPSYQATSTNIRCVLKNCGACSQEFYVGKDRVVRFGARWGTGQPFQYTPPTQQPPTPNNAQFGQLNKFFPRPNQTPSWGQNPNAPQQNAWNFPRQMPTNVPNNVPNVPGGMPNNMGQGLMNNMRNPMTNMRPGVTPNMPGYPNFGGGGGYPANSHICIPPPTQPRLCTENGENQHKFRLKEVIRMLGDKNIEKIPQCVPGVQRINCADYHLAQYIWKRGYCYCKRYHSNMNAFKRYAPLRCVLNNCGACSQEFYIGKSRIVDCD